MEKRDYVDTLSGDYVDTLSGDYVDTLLPNHDLHQAICIQRFSDLKSDYRRVGLKLTFYSIRGRTVRKLSNAHIGALNLIISRLNNMASTLTSKRLHDEICVDDHCERSRLK